MSPLSVLRSSAFALLKISCDMTPQLNGKQRCPGEYIRTAVLSVSYIATRASFSSTVVTMGFRIVALVEHAVFLQTISASHNVFDCEQTLKHHRAKYVYILKSVYHNRWVGQPCRSLFLLFNRYRAEASIGGKHYQNPLLPLRPAVERGRRTNS